MIRPGPEGLRRVFAQCEMTRRRSRDIVLRARSVPHVRPGWWALHSTGPSTGALLP